MGSFEEYMQDIKFKAEHPELFQDRKPTFKVGDVVFSFHEKYEKDLSYQYFIKEAVFVDNGNKPSEYIYEVAMIDNPDKSYTFKEDDLVLEYHDTNWAEYVTESVRNNLPAWRGELYNFYMFYGSPETHGKLNKELMKEYNNHTIPPAYMEHILESHAIYNRITSTINNSDKQNILMKTFNIDKKDLKYIADVIHEKINARNLNDLDRQNQRKLRNKQDDIEFTEYEKKFIDKVIELDDKKDIYPAEMTNLQIMRAIKEAYENAYKTGKSDPGQISKDKRTEEHFSPIDGNLYYRGESTSKPQLLIEFQYDRDLQVIATAYPIETNKKRQN